WRGSLFIGGENTAFTGRKCLATYHPASALRVYEQTSLLLFDLKGARTEGESPDLVLPETQIAVAQTTEDPRANTLLIGQRLVTRDSPHLNPLSSMRREGRVRGGGNRKLAALAFWKCARSVASCSTAPRNSPGSLRGSREDASIIPEPKQSQSILRPACKPESGNRRHSDRIHRSCRPFPKRNRRDQLDG